MVNAKDVVMSQPTFSLLANVTTLMLILPNFDSDKEKVLSLTGQNMTDFSSALSPNGTLASILTVKMASEESCYKCESSGEVLKPSK